MVEGRKARGKERGRVRRRGREIFITNKWEMTKLIFITNPVLWQLNWFLSSVIIPFMQSDLLWLSFFLLGPIF
jgi:hypothetical protein